MLSDIKKELIKHPSKIQNILEHFGFCHIEIHNSYINFGRNEEGSKKSIVIKLENNDWLMVKDYPKNIYCDFFSYIIKEKKVEFTEILNVVKNKLGITNYYDYFQSNTIFGGFYDNIKKQNNYNIKTYDNSILDQFQPYGNLRFFRDNISLQSQKFFNIRYDIESQGIVIPIYNQFGQIMGIKIRVNYDVEDGELKYYYHTPCLMSQTLYGYCQNYEYLVNNRVFVLESEKAILQSYTYGIRNCVSLGSSTISEKQIKMLLEVGATEIVLCHDKSLDFDTIKRNIKIIQLFSKLLDIKIGYLNLEDDDSIPLKSSPTDLGKEKFKEIIDNKIIWVKNEG